MPVRKVLLYYALKELGLDTDPTVPPAQNQIMLLNAAELNARTLAAGSDSKVEG